MCNRVGCEANQNIFDVKCTVISIRILDKSDFTVGLESVPWWLLLIMVTAGQDKKTNKQVRFSHHPWSKVTLRCWKKGQIQSNFSFAHLFGPCRFIAGVGYIFVMIELLLLCRSGVLLLLLLLLLERDKVSPLLVELSLQSICLSLFLHLFTFILLKTERLWWLKFIVFFLNCETSTRAMQLQGLKHSTTKAQWPSTGTHTQSKHACAGSIICSSRQTAGYKSMPGIVLPQWQKSGMVLQMEKRRSSVKR